MPVKKNFNLSFKSKKRLTPHFVARYKLLIACDPGMGFDARLEPISWREHTIKKPLHASVVVNYAGKPVNHVSGCLISMKGNNPVKKAVC